MCNLSGVRWLQTQAALYVSMQVSESGLMAAVVAGCRLQTTMRTQGLDPSSVFLRADRGRQGVLMVEEVESMFLDLLPESSVFDQLHFKVRPLPAQMFLLST